MLLLVVSSREFELEWYEMMDLALLDDMPMSIVDICMGIVTVLSTDGLT